LIRSGSKYFIFFMFLTRIVYNWMQGIERRHHWMNQSNGSLIKINKNALCKWNINRLVVYCIEKALRNAWKILPAKSKH
jgi:hypothetical protein